MDGWRTLMLYKQLYKSKRLKNMGRLNLNLYKHVKPQVRWIKNLNILVR